jgi:primosomal protein N' (replication factor Y) (superfamily II helicase)
MKYVDVILPLPLDGTFTYSVPDGMEGKVVPGVRLLVPLGKSKKYIAMATRLHDDKPAFSCKPVEAVLDNTPSLLCLLLSLLSASRWLCHDALHHSQKHEYE